MTSWSVVDWLDDHMFGVYAVGVVLAIFGLVAWAVCADEVGRRAHDNAERRAGEVLLEGPETAHGRVFYTTDGLRQVYCPYDAGSLEDCRWLANRSRAVAEENP